MILTRRTATVTISAPLASTARAGLGEVLVLAGADDQPRLEEFAGQFKSVFCMILRLDRDARAHQPPPTKLIISTLSPALSRRPRVIGLRHDDLIDLDRDPGRTQIELLRAAPPVPGLLRSCRLRRSDAILIGISARLSLARGTLKSRFSHAGEKRLRWDPNVPPLASLRRHDPDQVRGVLSSEVSVRACAHPQPGLFISNARRRRKNAGLH